MKQIKSFWAALAFMAAMTVGFSSCDAEEPLPEEGGNTDNPEIVTPADHSATAAIVNEAAKNISALLSTEINSAAYDAEKGEYIFSMLGLDDAITLKTSAATETVENSKISIVGEPAEGTTTWYWKVDGAEFKINEEKIAITTIPSFKIENDKWMASITIEEDAYTNYIEIGDWSDSDSSIDSFFKTITINKTIGEGEEAKKVAEFTLIDGTEFSVNYFVDEEDPGTPEKPEPAEKTLKDIVSFEITNIGSYTVDVVCTPTELCDKYSATIWCTAEDSAYDEGPDGTKIINYEKMTRETLGMFKASLTPNGGMQQHLISTAAHTYSEQDLIKGTPYDSDACKGFPNLFPGKNPYAIYVMALDKDGNYYIEYEEISVKSTTGNQCSIPVTINATPSQTSIEATITAEGASRVITYFMDGAYGSPTISDEAQQAKTTVYNGSYTYNTANEGALKPDHNYYIVVIAINAEGKVCLASQSVKTKKYEPDGSGEVETASFEPQTLRKKLNGTIKVSDGTTAIRTLFLDKSTFDALFDENTSNQQARINEMFLDPQKVREFTEEQNITGTTVNLEFDIDAVAEVWASQYAIWANVKDAEGKWSRPQNLAGLAKGSSDSAFTTYWDVITEDAAPVVPITFDSAGTLSFTESTAQSEITILPVSFSATGLDKIRFYVAEVDPAFLNNGLDEDNNPVAWTTLISDDNNESYWHEVSAAAGSIDITVAAGKSYVILASGIEADGHTFTAPVNVVALIQGHAANSTVTYQWKVNSWVTQNVTVPEYITIPTSLGGEDPGEGGGRWDGTATVDFTITTPPTSIDDPLIASFTNKSSNCSNVFWVIFNKNKFDSVALDATSLAKYTKEGFEEMYDETMKKVKLTTTSGVMISEQSGTTATVGYNTAKNYLFIVVLTVDSSNKSKLIGYYDVQSGLDGSTVVTSF